MTPLEVTAPRCSRTRSVARATSNGARKIFKLGLSFGLLTPMVALAARFNDAAELLNFFTNFIRVSVIPFLIALAVIYFLWGVGKFIKNADNETERETGKKFMIYGIIGLFVIVAFWGIVQVLINTFGTDSILPSFPTTSGGSIPGYSDLF